MDRYYQYVSQISIGAILVLTSTAVDLAWAQREIQPRKGDADRLRPAQGQSISPTNTDQFLIDRDFRNSNLKVQNLNFKVEAIQPVIPGNNNASPQKVNRSGNFSSDPLNAVQIFQESGTSQREK